MASWVAETCRWLLCNKITFIQPSKFTGSFKTFIYVSGFFVEGNYWHQHTCQRKFRGLPYIVFWTAAFKSVSGSPRDWPFCHKFFFSFFFFPGCCRCPSKCWDPFQVPDWYCVRHMRVCQINSSELDLLLGSPPNCCSPLAGKRNSSNHPQRTTAVSFLYTLIFMFINSIILFFTHPYIHPFIRLANFFCVFL